MKYFLSILLLSLLMSCSREVTKDNRIVIKGSDTMYLLMQRLAAEYMHSNPGISIYVSGGGTKAGFEALDNKSADICMASRDLEAREVKQLAQNHMKIGISYLIAKDALSIYLNPNIQVTDFTVQQIRDVFSGKIQNWSELGGRDMEITTVIRNSKSGTNAFFKQAIMDNEDFKNKSIVRNTTKQVIDEVYAIDGAVGFGGIAFKGFVAFAKINGISPNKENIQNDSYELIRYLHLYTLRTPSGNIKEFIDWTMSEEAQRIINEFGYFSLW
jgi:phosphate transport system substrate-binding protein